MHQFYDENGRTCKMLFADEHIIRKTIKTNVNYMQNDVIVLLEV